MADNLLQGLQVAANATSQAGVSFSLTIFFLNRSVGDRTSYSNAIVRPTFDYRMSVVSPTSRFANGRFANVSGQFANISGQFANV